MTHLRARIPLAERYFVVLFHMVNGADGRSPFSVK